MSASSNGVIFAISPAQVRAARGLLDWTRGRLSESSGVPVRTLDRLEKAEGAPQTRTLAAIRAALEAAGVEFTEANGGGVGVRFLQTKVDPE